MRYILLIVKNKWFWIGLAIVIVLFILWRNWDKIKSRLGRVHGDFQPGSITDKRKSELEALAQEAYNGIYSTVSEGSGAIITTLKKIYALNDNEIDYLARYYENALTRGNSLYKDIDDEWMPFTSTDENLMSKLNALGLM